MGPSKNKNQGWKAAFLEHERKMLAGVIIKSSNGKYKITDN